MVRHLHVNYKTDFKEDCWEKDYDPKLHSIAIRKIRLVLFFKYKIYARYV
jgi:hypothetical protein